MGSQWTMQKGLYVADNGDIFIVGIRDEQRIKGGFILTSSANQVDLPRGLRMRYVLGRDPVLGGFQKLYIASATDPLWLVGAGLTSFLYGGSGFGTTFDITARIGEKRTNRF